MAFSELDALSVSVDELERIAAAGWPGVETLRLGDWWLRAGHGFTGRANSALLIGSPALPFDDALSAVEMFYRQRELPPQLQVPDLPGDTSGAASSFIALNAALDHRGWARHNAAWVMIAPLDQLRSAVNIESRLPATVLEPTPSELWLSGYHYRGHPLPPHAAEVIAAGSDPVFATISADGDLMGVARGVVTESWLGITAVTVSPAHRRRGAARALMGALARWAGDRGARFVYLQVDVANDVALQMYDRLGFVRHHRYHYRRPGSPG